MPKKKRAQLPDALTFDVLHASTCQPLAATPDRLADLVPADYRGWVMIDEVQRVHELLNEVRRLIESSRKRRFALTGSSALKLDTAK